MIPPRKGRQHRGRKRVPGVATNTPARHSPGGESWGTTVVIVVLVVGLGAFMLRARLAPRATHAATAIDSIGRMSADEAFHRGGELARQERHLESLPYLRRAAHDPDASSAMHYGYSLELHNAAYAGRMRGAIAGHAQRSSAERVAVVLESLHESELAESLAPTPHVRALIADQRGRTLLLWGFPLDAVREYRHALAMDTSFTMVRQDIEVCRKLVDPEFLGPVPGYPGNARRAPMTGATHR